MCSGEIRKWLKWAELTRFSSRDAHRLFKQLRALLYKQSNRKEVAANWCAQFPGDAEILIKIIGWLLKAIVF
jgi:hypothetical protein